MAWVLRFSHQLMRSLQLRTRKGKIVLLGLINYAYDRRTTKHEALWYSHHVQYNKVKVRDVSKEEGGDKCIRINN